MPSTTNLSLPYMDANQNQKYVTYNDALRTLDALAQIQVQDSVATPPGSPADGQCWIVAASATGAWAGKDQQIAAWQDGAWSFYTPRAGYIAYDLAGAAALIWTGSAWTSLLGAVTSLMLARLGIGTAADPANPLAVMANNILFEALATGAGGTGDIRLKLNKSSASNTASLLYQDGFSGRAEVGLAGDDNFHLKVSSDGTTWHDALSVAASSGAAAWLVTPTAPTAAPGDASTKLATTAFVQANAFTSALLFG